MWAHRAPASARRVLCRAAVSGGSDAGNIVTCRGCIVTRIFLKKGKKGASLCGKKLF